MTPYHESPAAQFYLGDSPTVLADMQPCSARTCVTSPPYYGLRAYLPEGHPDKDKEVGQEDTPEEYVDRLVALFRQVRRVLTEDGTLWLNIGDSYARGFGGGSPGPKSATNKGSYAGRKPGRKPVGLKGKDLIGVPWMVAFAMRKDGWCLRCDVVWNKPNAMTESVLDRPSRSHEYLFLLTKSERYFYDREAILEPTESGPLRNRRSVWSVPTKASGVKHYATFPPSLVQPCILAGSAPGDTVLDPFCGIGTTGTVAVAHGRRFVGIDLNSEYLAIAAARVTEAVGKEAG
jgi:site-specific DNA-methyltransferase (adenine-specific)